VKRHNLGGLQRHTGHKSNEFIMVYLRMCETDVKDSYIKSMFEFHRWLIKHRVFIRIR
jgi:hypothetical protein